MRRSNLLRHRCAAMCEWRISTRTGLFSTAAPARRFLERLARLHDAELAPLQRHLLPAGRAWVRLPPQPGCTRRSRLAGAPHPTLFEQCGRLPAEAYPPPNKDELAAICVCFDRRGRNVRWLRRRCSPPIAGPLDPLFIRQEDDPRLRLQKRLADARYVAGRAVFHARALLPTLSKSSGSAADIPWSETLAPAAYALDAMCSQAGRVGQSSRIRAQAGGLPGCTRKTRLAIADDSLQPEAGGVT